MDNLLKTNEPFRFYTRLHLSELTGLKASTAGELLELVKTVPGSAIYHHTHHFLEQHQHLSPEPPNDFAYWTSNVLGEPELGERLASIDIIQYSTIRGLRDEIAEEIENYLRYNPQVQTKAVRKGAEFYFIKSNSFVFPLEYCAYDLRQMADILKKVTVDSIYYHIFESRLRLEKGDNDFSLWIEKSFGNKKLANAISQMDPYTHTMDELRNAIVRLIERYIQ